MKVRLAIQVSTLLTPSSGLWMVRYPTCAAPTFPPQESGSESGGSPSVREPMPVCWLMGADEGRALARPSALDNMAVQGPTRTGVLACAQQMWLISYSPLSH